MAQLIVRLKDRELQRVSITNVATRIGRDVSNDVVIHNDGVSRHHATVRYDADEGVFFVFDAGSNNGIMVRGRVTPEARLSDGDEVQVGKFTVVFLASGGVHPDTLSPEEPTVAIAAHVRASRNPLPTTAMRAASRPRAQGVGAGLASTPPSATATVSISPTTPRSFPPADQQAAIERVERQTLMLRRLTILLGVVVLLLAVVIGMLLARR